MRITSRAALSTLVVVSALGLAACADEGGTYYGGNYGYAGAGVYDPRYDRYYDYDRVYYPDRHRHRHHGRRDRDHWHDRDHDRDGDRRRDGDRDGRWRGDRERDGDRDRQARWQQRDRQGDGNQRGERGNWQRGGENNARQPAAISQPSRDAHGHAAPTVRQENQRSDGSSSGGVQAPARRSAPAGRTDRETRQDHGG